jgi:hypothetical protein
MSIKNSNTQFWYIIVVTRKSNTVNYPNFEFAQEQQSSTMTTGSKMVCMYSLTWLFDNADVDGDVGEKFENIQETSFLMKNFSYMANRNYVISLIWPCLIHENKFHACGLHSSMWQGSTIWSRSIHVVIHVIKFTHMVLFCFVSPMESISFESCISYMSFNFIHMTILVHCTNSMDVKTFYGCPTLHFHPHDLISSMLGVLIIGFHFAS